LVKKVLVVSLVLILALTVLSGCKPKTQVYTDKDGTRVEKDGDTLIVTGKDGERGALTTGDNLAWPKSLMGDLPELKGNVVSVVESDDGNMVIVEGVKRSDFEAYTKQVEAKGYASDGVMDYGGALLFVGAKGNSEVSMTFSADGDKGTVMIVFVQK